MPTVLVVHPSTELYGSDRQLAESVAAFVDDGWDTVVCLPDDGALRSLLPGARIEVLPYAVLRKVMLSPRGLLRLLLHLPGELSRLVRLIRAVRPDVVYVNTVTIPWWLVAATLTRTPVVAHVHEAEDQVAGVLRLALNLPLLLARSVIANSRASREVVVAAIPRLSARTIVIPNGVPDRGAATRNAALPGRIALVARLSPRKGIDVALEAVAQVRATRLDVTLDVCGTVFRGYEWYENELRARAARPDLAGAVRFLGYVDPTTEVLAAASIVLVPSRLEPFGNTAVEGMLAERPVIASDVQGLGEILTDGVTGLLVRADDPADLAAAIIRLCDDPAMAWRLARAGRAVAVSDFSVQRYRHAVLGVAADLVVA